MRINADSQGKCGQAKGHFLSPQVPLLQPLKQGHLSIKDTFFRPVGVRIRGVPLYVRSLDRYVLYIDRESRERSGVGFV